MQFQVPVVLASSEPYQRTKVIPTVVQ